MGDKSPTSELAELRAQLGVVTDERNYHRERAAKLLAQVYELRAQLVVRANG